MAVRTTPLTNEGGRAALPLWQTRPSPWAPANFVIIMNACPDHLASLAFLTHPSHLAQPVERMRKDDCAGAGGGGIHASGRHLEALRRVHAPNRNQQSSPTSATEPEQRATPETGADRQRMRKLTARGTETLRVMLVAPAVAIKHQARLLAGAPTWRAGRAPRLSGRPPAPPSPATVTPRCRAGAGQAHWRGLAAAAPGAAAPRGGGRREADSVERRGAG